MEGLGGGEVAGCRMDWAREMLRVDGVAGGFGVGCEDKIPRCIDALVLWLRPWRSMPCSQLHATGAYLVPRQEGLGRGNSQS